MDEWCLICHKVTRFAPVMFRESTHRYCKQPVPDLWYCEECHTVIYREEQISEEEKKAARERAALLEGFD